MLNDPASTDDIDVILENTESIDPISTDDNDLVLEETEFIDPTDDNDLALEDTELIDPVITDDNDLVLEESEFIDPISADDNDLVLENTESIDPISTDNNVISENSSKNKYLVIVQVFSNEANAINSIADNDLNYLSLNGKYYVYAFSSKNRQEAESFRSVYKQGCWILDPK